MKTKCLKCEVVFEINSCIPIEAQSLCPTCYAIDNIFRACALFVMIEKNQEVLHHWIWGNKFDEIKKGEPDEDYF